MGLESPRAHRVTSRKGAEDSGPRYYADVPVQGPKIFVPLLGAVSLRAGPRGWLGGLRIDSCSSDVSCHETWLAFGLYSILIFAGRLGAAAPQQGRQGGGSPPEQNRIICSLAESPVG